MARLRSGWTKRGSGTRPWHYCSGCHKGLTLLAGHSEYKEIIMDGVKQWQYGVERMPLESLVAVVAQTLHVRIIISSYFAMIVRIHMVYEHVHEDPPWLPRNGQGRRCTIGVAPMKLAGTGWLALVEFLLGCLFGRGRDSGLYPPPLCTVRITSLGLRRTKPQVIFDPPRVVVIQLVDCFGPS